MPLRFLEPICVSPRGSSNRNSTVWVLLDEKLEVNDIDFSLNIALGYINRSSAIRIIFDGSKITSIY